MKLNFLRSNVIICIFLFFTALVPRAPDLGRFLTADEFLWVDRSRNFLAGMLDDSYECTSEVEKWDYEAEGLACTLRTGHPGVTTMWTGSFGFWLSWLPRRQTTSLYDYVVNASTNPLDPHLIVPERLGTVVITSLWVVAFYLLAQRLFGKSIAFVGALLTALDPFHIALSRVIHHDALSTTFMTLSALAAFVYWGQRAERRWLVFSGILAGFAFLSKSPALYLMPFIAVVGLWFLARETINKRKHDHPLSSLRRSFTRTVLDGLLWFAAAIATVFAAWPAMWTAPVEAIETVFFIGSKYATGGHAKGNFFLGEVSNDPGPLFYPVSWLYRTSPLVLIGVAVILAAWGWFLWRRSTNRGQADRWWSQAPFRNFFAYLPLILIFILGYYTLMTIGEKKQDRYFLPVYPWLNLMAGGGLVLLAGSLASLVKRGFSATNTTRLSSAALLPLLLTVLVVNGYLAAAHFPYYFTYYNPLLGGPTRAADVLTIGWGEGLDLAADFFNQRIRTRETRVASWYESTFAPFYYGESISYSKEKGKALAGDYVIFYINQMQRRFPDEVMFDYFEQRFEPVETISLHGLDYVWIYPSLGVDHYVDDQTYSGIASLLAWQLVPGQAALTPGEAVNFEIYWEYLGKQSNEPFFLRLVDAQNRTWAEGVSQAAIPPIESWREGEIVVDRGQLRLPRIIPPGQYRWQIGLYTNAPAVTEGELLFELRPEDAPVEVDSRPATLPMVSTAPKFSPKPFAEALTLFDAEWPEEPLTAPTTIPVELYWRVDEPLPANATVHVGLMDESGEAQQGWFNLTLSDILNPAEVTWQRGDILRTRWELDLLPDVPPGLYHLELIWAEDTSQVLPVGELVVAEQPQ